MRYIMTMFALIAALLTGCETMDQVSKEDVGTYTGVVLGGLAGSRVGGDSGMFASAAGAALGGLLGKQIGKALDEKDKAAIEQQAARSLEGTPDGETVDWNNPQSGASAKLTPRQTQTVEKRVQVVRDVKVEPVSNMQLIGRTYQAKSDANVRAAPTTSSSIVASVQRDEHFNVVGKVQGKNWYQISSDGRSIGYIYGSLIEQTATAENVQLREAVDLDAIDLDDDVTVDSVTAETECRVLDYQVTTGDGESEQDSFKACKAADGAWELG